MENRNKESGSLYLIPTPIVPYDPVEWKLDRLRATISPAILDRLFRLTHFIVESEKSALRLLSRILPADRLNELVFMLLDEHSTSDALIAPLVALKNGNDCALLSEAGMPCIADPGSALVAAAHAENLRVVPMGGESSLMLALAGSGLNGQKFCFLGYLPVQEQDLRKMLVAEGTKALSDGAARIFIETPYRNAKTFKACIESLPERLHFSCACALGTQHSLIKSMQIARWRNLSFEPPSEPAVFCFGLPAGLPPHQQQRRARRA